MSDREEQDAPPGGTSGGGAHTGNDRPTHPDIMGPYPSDDEQLEGIPSKEEQRPPKKDAVPDERAEP
jgi:hypothetical protein